MSNYLYAEVLDLEPKSEKWIQVKNGKGHCDRIKMEDKFTVKLKDLKTGCADIIWL